jgi:hypothetical protein
MLLSTFRFLAVLSACIGLAFCNPQTSDSRPSRLPKSVTLSYELLSSSTTSAAKPLVTISYDPKTLKHALVNWTPPSVETLQSTTSEPTSSPLLRILLPNGSSTITTLQTFNSSLHQKINLWLTPASGEVFSASVSALSPPPLSADEERYQKKVERAKAKGKPIPARPPIPNTKKAREEAAKEAALYEPIKVNLVSASTGPSPILNSRGPPQVDAEGREVAQDEQPEKSFFMKYWWVFMIMAMLSLSGAGGKDK